MSAPGFVVRAATADDISALHRIRLAVRENQLAAATAVSTESYVPFVAGGTIWVAECDGQMFGFAALDVGEANVWALFVDPQFEEQGAGRALHDHMLRSASAKGLPRLWLTTAPGTRAEQFYSRLGWMRSAVMDTGEIRFERQVPIQTPR